MPAATLKMSSTCNSKSDWFNEIEEPRRKNKVVYSRMCNALPAATSETTVTCLFQVILHAQRNAKIPVEVRDFSRTISDVPTPSWHELQLVTVIQKFPDEQNACDNTEHAPADWSLAHAVRNSSLHELQAIRQRYLLSSKNAAVLHDVHHHHSIAHAAVTSATNGRQTPIAKGVRRAQNRAARAFWHLAATKLCAAGVRASAPADDAIRIPHTSRQSFGIE
eukprot:6201147-Pleurochrysis_carterae.AAC.1